MTARPGLGLVLPEEEVAFAPVAFPEEPALVGRVFLHCEELGLLARITVAVPGAVGK